MAGNALVDYAVEHLTFAQVSGHAPHGCVVIPFGRVDRPGHTFPANEFNKLTLKLTGESGAGAVRIIGQQLRK